MRLVRFIRMALSVFVPLALVAGALNFFVRFQATGADSHGIVEHMIFGSSARAAFGRMLHSEEFIRYDDAARLSAQLLDLLQEHGVGLASDPGLKAERQRAAILARAAYVSARAVPDGYLAGSNPELPTQYKDHFAESMRLLAEGLENSARARVSEGIDQYNNFLLWIQARSRSDFKSLQ